MTDQKEIILKAIVYEIVIAAGEEGTKGKRPKVVLGC